jgi:hypothetical protein
MLIHCSLLGDYSKEVCGPQGVKGILGRASCLSNMEMFVAFATYYSFLPAYTLSNSCHVTCWVLANFICQLHISELPNEDH